MTDMKSLWRNQQTEETVTLENIHERAEKFQHQVRWRNMVEYGASVVAVAACGFVAWALPGWMIKAGMALEIVAVLFIVWQLHRRGSAQSVPNIGLVDYHRRQLMRQRDMLRSVWLWYLLPFIPGMTLVMMGRWFQFHAPGRSLAWDHEIILLASAVVVLFFAIVWLINALAAMKLQRKIDELDKLSK